MLSKLYPRPGTFVKPVGRRKWFAYCYEVVSAEPHPRCAPGIDYMECRRWGWDDATQQPIDDGHCGPGHHSYFSAAIRSVGEGEAWRLERDGSPDFLDPVYFRRVDRLGQQELFA